MVTVGIEFRLSSMSGITKLFLTPTTVHNNGPAFAKTPKPIL